jgi:hypothetical protein
VTRATGPRAAVADAAERPGPGTTDAAHPSRGRTVEVAAATANTGWIRLAACRDGVDPRVFDLEGASTRTVAVAAAACSRCPVVEECADAAAEEEANGVIRAGCGWRGGRPAPLPCVPRSRRPVHGTRSRFRHGCRCAPCAAAEDAYQRTRWGAVAELPLARP